MRILGLFMVFLVSLTLVMVGTAHGQVRHKLELVGSNGLELSSQTSDLDIEPERNVAYVGSFVDLGVAVVNMADRAHPRVATILNTHYPGYPTDRNDASDSADVDVKGNLLAVANQPFNLTAFGFGGQGFGGVSLYDISDAFHPKFIGQAFTGGTHDVQIDPGYPARPFVYAANYFSTWDVSIIDVTKVKSVWPDPGFKNRDAIISSYHTDEPQGCTNPQGCHDFGGPYNAAHDLTLLIHPATHHVLLYVAYWDSGFRIVDVTDPAHPREIGKRDYTPGPGSALPFAEPLAGGTCCAHYVQPTPSGDWVLTEDEMGVGTAGNAHIYSAKGCDGVQQCQFGPETKVSDWSPSGRDVQASAIHATINTNGRVEPNGIFQRFFTRDIHNLDVQEDQFLAPAYSSGVFLVDMHDKAHPVEVAFWQEATDVKTACHGNNPVVPLGFMGDCFFQAREVWGAKFGEPVPGSPMDFFIYASDFWDGFLIFRTVTV